MWFPGIHQLFKIEVYNVIGDKVLEVDLGKNASGNLILNTQKLARGTYFIRINTENLVYSKKWLKL